MAVAAAVAEAGGNGAGLAGLAGVSVLMILRNRDGAVKQRVPIFDEKLWAAKLFVGKPIYAPASKWVCNLNYRILDLL